eukprot:581466-Amphidinium_carterae.1
MRVCHHGLAWKHLALAEMWGHGYGVCVVGRPRWWHIPGWRLQGIRCRNTGSSGCQQIGRVNLLP